MFSAVLFAQDQTAARAVEQTAMASEQVCIYKIVSGAPGPYEVTRALNLFNPDIVFVELTGFDGAPSLARAARATCPDAAIIGFAQTVDEERERLARESGVAAILYSPLTAEKFQEAVEQAMRKTRASIQENLLAFLPSKAGSGSTTVALNSAASLARDCGHRVLVIEADLRSGPMSILLKLDPKYSIQDALNAGALDATLWNSLVVKAEGLDILPTCRPTERALVSWSGYHQLLQFVRPRYDSIIVDMPEVINEAMLEVVRRARAVYIVTTLELASLALVRQRRRELKAQGIEDERIAVVMNRWGTEEIQAADVESFLEQRVAAVFQNDYPAVRRATQQARLLSTKSELGRSFSAFACQLAGVPAKAAGPKSRLSFLDSLLPRRSHATR